MSIIIDVLREEKERLDRNIKIYVQEINDLPKGAVIEKKRGRKIYYYLSFRDAEGKTRQTYLKCSPSEIDQLKREIEKRRRLEKALRELRREKKLVEKMLKLSP